MSSISNSSFYRSDTLATVKLPRPSITLQQNAQSQCVFATDSKTSSILLSSSGVLVSYLQNVAFGTLFSQIALALLIWYCVAWLSRKQLEHWLWRQHGCLPPKALPSKLPFGLDRLYQIYKAYSRNELPKMFASFVEGGGNTFHMKIFGVRLIGTQDLQNIEAVVSSKLDSFTTAKKLHTLSPMMKQSVMTQEGTQWKHTRNHIKGPLSRPRYRNLRVFQTHVDDLISRIPTDRPIDLHKLFYQFTMDTATSFLFGQSIGSLRVPQGAAEAEFEKAFHDSFTYVAKRGLVGPARHFLSRTKFKKDRDIVFNYIDNIVTNVQRQRAVAGTDVKGEEESKTPLIDSLLDGKSDFGEIRDNLIFGLAAGNLTTATLLSWAMKHLSRDQKVMVQLRAEISAVIGDDKSTSLNRSVFSRMPYLNNVIKEIERLYPIIRAMPYTATEDVILPSGGGPRGNAPMLLRAGEDINILLWTLHRRKDIWGEDAEDFRPERWENLTLPSIYCYMPFSRGPRACPAQDFAVTEASYTIVRLLQEFPTLQVPPEELVRESTMDDYEGGFIIASGSGCVVEARR